MRHLKRIAACCAMALLWIAGLACTASHTAQTPGPVTSAPAAPYTETASPAAEDAGTHRPTGTAAAPEPGATLERTALQWLDAVRKADRAALARLSRYPFQLRTTGADVPCTSEAALASDEPKVSLATAVDAPSASELAGTVDCLVTDKLLSEELSNNPQLPTSALQPHSLPRWAKRWKRELRAGAVAELVDVVGDGITYHFIMQVDDGGVRSVWKHAEFDSN